MKKCIILIVFLFSFFHVHADRNAFGWNHLCSASSSDPTSFMSALYSDMGYITANIDSYTVPLNMTALSPEELRGMDTRWFLQHCRSHFQESNRIKYFDLFPFIHGEEHWGTSLDAGEVDWHGDLFTTDSLITFESQYRDILRFYYGVYEQSHTLLYIDQVRIDDEIAYLLNTIDLNSSIVILLGDHGIHYGKFSSVLFLLPFSFNTWLFLFVFSCRSSSSRSGSSHSLVRSRTNVVVGSRVIPFYLVFSLSPRWSDEDREASPSCEGWSNRGM